MKTYLELFKYIRKRVMPFQDVITLSSITSKMSEIMKSKGVLAVKDSTKKHIRRKLEVEFGSSLTMFSDDTGKVLLFPSHATIYDIAKKYHAAKQDLKLLQSKSSESKAVDQASSLLRRAIKDMEKPDVWPYHPSDVTQNSLVIPPELQRFYLGLLTGKPEQKCSQRVEMLMKSFSQDVIYAVSAGQQKPPKHVLLSYGIQALTGNAELVKTLNRLGHAISYSQLEENDTALCLQKLAAAKNQRVILPVSIQPYIFTNLA